MNIISAIYGDANRASVVVQTEERGAVAISEVDSPELWAQLHESGIAIEPFYVEMPTPEEIIAEQIKVMDDAIKQRLNDKAIEMRFDGIASAILASSLPVGEYRQDDGAKLHLWSARTWQKAEQIRDAFLAALAADSTVRLLTWAEVEAELPTYPITQD